MCSVKYKEHRWAVNLHRHYVDSLQLSKNTVSSRPFTRNENFQSAFAQFPLRGQSHYDAHEHQTIRNSHHGDLSPAELLPHSRQLCVPSNTRSIDGQSICTGTMWTRCSFPRILFLQGLSQGMKTFNRLLHNSRYVDNRIMMHFPEWRQHQPWDTFTRLDFYNPPILLEEVDDSEILGCHISTEQRSITIRQLLDLVTLRSGLSLSSSLRNFAGFPTNRRRCRRTAPLRNRRCWCHTTNQHHSRRTSLPQYSENPTSAPHE